MTSHILAQIEEAIRIALEDPTPGRYPGGRHPLETDESEWYRKGYQAMAEYLVQIMLPYWLTQWGEACSNMMICPMCRGAGGVYILGGKYNKNVWFTCESCEDGWK